jgi:hypothetical protein
LAATSPALWREGLRTLAPAANHEEPQSCVLKLAVAGLAIRRRPPLPPGLHCAASPGQTPSSGVGPRTQLLFNDVVDVSGGASEGGEDEDVGGDLPEGSDACGVPQSAAVIVYDDDAGRLQY